MVVQLSPGAPVSDACCLGVLIGKEALMVALPLSSHAPHNCSLPLWKAQASSKYTLVATSQLLQAVSMQSTLALSLADV